MDIDWGLLFIVFMFFCAGYVVGQTRLLPFRSAGRALLHVTFAHLDRREYFSPYERAIIREAQKLLK